MQLDEVLAETRALGAEWSISIRRHGDAGAVLEHQADRLLRTASVAKVFVLLEVANRLAAGTIRADDLVDRRGTPRILDSGLWRSMRADRLPVADLALLVGAVSDNWATNVLLGLCGLDRVQAAAAALAPGGSMLHDYVRDHRGAGVPETLSHGCAADWSAIMQRLVDADGIDRAVSEQVLGWLGRDTDLSMVASAFALDPLAHDVEDLGVRLWHKTGTDRGVRADVGVVRSASATVSYAVICNWPPADDTRTTRHAVLAAMRRLGDAIGGE